MHSAIIDWLTHHKLLNWLSIFNWLLVSFSNTKPSLFYFQCKEKLWLPGSIIADLWFTELPSPSQPDFAFPNEKTKTSRPKQPDFTFPMHRHIHWTFCEPLWVLLSCFSFFTEDFCQICDQMERQSCPQPPFFCWRFPFFSFHCRLVIFEFQWNDKALQPPWTYFQCKDKDLQPPSSLTIDDWPHFLISILLFHISHKSKAIELPQQFFPVDHQLADRLASCMAWFFVFWIHKFSDLFSKINTFSMFLVWLHSSCWYHKIY